MRLGDMTAEELKELCQGHFCGNCPLKDVSLCEDLPSNWDLDVEVDV